jgi:hypothetical protein
MPHCEGIVTWGVSMAHGNCEWEEVSNASSIKVVMRAKLEHPYETQQTAFCVAHVPGAICARR